MKQLTALLILLLVCSLSQTVSAQAADPWVTVPLEGDQRTIEMPKSHEVNRREFSFEQFKVDGRVYTATEGGVDYTVWSLIDKGDANNGLAATGAYFDACADLVWESLLKPRRDQIPKELKLTSRMSYEGVLRKTHLLLGREYSIMLANRPGLTRFYVTGPQIYVLIVLNEDANSAAAQRFINSFAVKGSALPVAATLAADWIPLGTGRGGGIGPGEVGGIGPGRGGNVSGGAGNTGGGGPSTATTGSTDYNRVLSGREVTQKARVTSKPEPSYTESARKYSVQGTVGLRAVFSRSGEVTQIRVISGLPHGLTPRAIAAAREIKFIPALKDGHAVSMHMMLVYNFNLY